MRYVAIKSVEQQAALTLHRTRDLLVKQRTQLVNMIRGLLAEFGIEIPRGITQALTFVRADCDGRSPGHTGAGGEGDRDAWPSRRSSGRLGCARLERELWPGTARATVASGSRPIPGVGPSAPRRWPPR